jgi:hypothetical protein
MMGYQTKVQNQLFYTNFNLSQRIRQDHILRKINTHIDFDFIYNEVKDKYGINGIEEIPKSGIANKKYISTTDPDASVSRRGKGSSTLQYQIHRGVDSKHEVITAIEVTPGEVNEAHRMPSLIDSHQDNTGKTVDTVVADSKYGTIDNYLACFDRHIQGHFESFDKGHR